MTNREKVQQHLEACDGCDVRLVDLLLVNEEREAPDTLAHLRWLCEKIESKGDDVGGLQSLWTPGWTRDEERILCNAIKDAERRLEFYAVNKS